MASIQIGDAVVSGLVKLVLAKLCSSAFVEIGRIYRLKDELKKLENTLFAINAVLLDAEEQQSTNNSDRNWLLNLKDVVYDIEDVLDLISTQDLETKVKKNNLYIKLKKLFSRYSFTQKLKAIRRKLDDIAGNRENYSLLDNRPFRLDASIVEQRETYSSILESHTFGREQEKEWIISHLLNPSIDDKHLPVVPITGMGGMGKTTLVQLVFNDPRVVRNFQLRLWVYVSKKYVLKSVIAKIIESDTGWDFSNLSMEELQKKLHVILAKKRFLLVLDDVWIEDSKQWFELKSLLIVGSRNMIIVTTRQDKVAVVTGTMDPYKVTNLPDDHCWSIFVKHAFGEHEDELYPLLVKIGRSIVRKCSGVPLAVKTLGSLLRDKRDDRTWEQIAESKLCEIYQLDSDILPVLKLSLDDTPFQLRSCFAFCSLFGKGYPFYRAEIINLWTALGFLRVQEGHEDAINVGRRYFDELLSRSFLQLPSVQAYNYMQRRSNLVQLSYQDAISHKFMSLDGKITCAEMHDVMHDLATFVAGKEIAVVTSNVDEISAGAKHIVWDEEELTGKDFPNRLLEARKARSLAFLHPMGSISKSFLERLLSNFKCLRVLMVLYSEFEELPESVGNLKHLRYLKIYRNSILKLLPISTRKLVNLQVLHVKYSDHLETLPKGVENLLSLSVLVLTSKITRLPERYLQGWSSLEVLKLYICPNLESLSEGFGCLRRLQILLIRACHELASLPNNTRNLVNLEKITIQNCKKLDLTGWKGLHYLKGLRYLFISELPKLLDFPDGVESAAGSLQCFRIGECADLRSLPEGLNCCTSLLKLQVLNCPNLILLPRGIDGLEALQELRISGCPQLSCRCERGGDDWPLISHVPEVYIDEVVIQTRHPTTSQGNAGLST